MQFVLTSTRSMKNCHTVVIRWPYAMYQTLAVLTSYAALWLLYQTNLPCCVARRTLSKTISRLLPSKQEQMRPPLPREISRLTSHARLNVMGSVCTPVHALMFETKSNYIQDSFLHTSICYFSFLKAAKDWNDILKAILTNPEKRFSLTYYTIDYNVTEVELKWTVLVDFHLAFLKVSYFHCYSF